MKYRTTVLSTMLIVMAVAWDFSLAVSTSSADCVIDPSGTYIDAENFSDSAGQSGNADENFSELSDADANGGLALLSGAADTCGDAADCEIKEYLVNFNQSGTYYFWARGKGDNPMGGGMLFTVDDGDWKQWTFEGDIYSWTNSLGAIVHAIDVAEGVHTIKIAMSAANNAIDGFYLTTGGESPIDSTIPSNVTSINPNECEDAGHISTDIASIGPSTYLGYNASSKSFELTNTGTQPLTDITIAVSDPWMSVSQSSISELKVNETVNIGVDFNTSTLQPNTYTADIVVESASSSNTSHSLQVTLLVKSVPTSAACGEIPLYAESLANPAVMVQLDTSGSMNDPMFIMASGENPATPDLSTIVQEIVDLAGWETGNAMVFRISGTGNRRAWSYDGQPNGAPKLVVSYTSSSTMEEVEHQVSASGSDLQSSGGVLESTETFLELGRSGEPVGIKFSDIEIPAGATITNAEIKFLINEGNDVDTDLVVDALLTANADTDLTEEILTATTGFTSETVAWDNVESWSATMSRIDIAEDVLKEVFLDRAIAWGFATWSGGDGGVDEVDDTGNNYTTYLVGVHPHDDPHHAVLQDKADDGTADGWTPLAPTLHAGLQYFTEERADVEYGQTYDILPCQPRILVVVTDGLGNTGTTVDLAKQRATELTTEGISVVTVGFGLSDATQLIEIAKIANDKGEVSADDSVYALHDVDADGNGIPFLAQSREEFVDAMNSIVKSIKANVFHGSAPAPTTSADNGEVLLTSTFNAADWSGNLIATKFNAADGTLEANPLWDAQDKMPSTIGLDCYIYDGNEIDLVSDYIDSSLAGDNYLCKPLGDIINSTPKIVGKPPFFYNFDGYRGFKYSSPVSTRDPLAYINSNDGALHAFDMDTGVEKWRFYPDSVKAKLDVMALDPVNDMCATSYCHKFISDGSPQAADIYTGSNWKTILISGLGLGGEAYYALDITYGNGFTPEDGDSDTNDIPSAYLWEFTNSDDAEIGLATAFPEIERVPEYIHDGSNWVYSGAQWVTYFGSGPAINDALQADKEAYLFAVRSNDKAKVWLSDTSLDVTDIYKVKLENGVVKNDIPSSPLLVNIEEDDYESDRIYLGNRYGDLFRVDDIGVGETPIVEKLFDLPSTDHSAPIVAKPGFAYAGDPDHDNIDDIRVYFGTGKFEDQVDKETPFQQYFIGLFDGEGAKSPAYELDDLFKLQTDMIQAYALDINGDRVDLDKSGTVDSNDMFTYRTIDCAAAGKDADGNCNSTKASWAIELMQPQNIGSERVVAQPLIVGGIAFFTTFIPDGDPCEGNGDAYLLAVDWETGEAKDPDYVVFDINGDGVFDSSDATVEDENGNTFKVIGFPVGTGVPTEPVLHGDVLFVGTSGQPPKPTKVNLPDYKTRVKAWRQIFN